MPDISFPEVHLPDFKLPEGLREMNREDIQKSMPDVKMPDVNMPKIDLPKRKDISRELAKATKELEKAGRDLEKNLPRRPGPSPLPFVIFGMLSGLVVGWLLASSPTTAPRISSLVDDLKGRIDRWRSAALDSAESGPEPAAYHDATYAGAMSDAQTGVGVGPADLTNGIGSTPQGVGSERT
jgi:hypothetical protein